MQIFGNSLLFTTRSAAVGVGNFTQNMVLNITNTGTPFTNMG